MKPLIPLQHHTLHNKNYLLLLAICLLAYWPLTFGIFSVKNDAIHYFLPYRFQISETLRQGEWPFWSPYIYLGYPVHGDMQSGAWNPIVWIFSFLGRYDITLFHYENLLYIFLGSVGMYKLTNRLAGHSQTALLIAASYMLSGFMLNGQLINWLAAAAFFPFVIHYYLQTLHSSYFINSLKTGIALYFLFVAGYPSFVIITGYLLFFLFILSIVRRSRNSFTNKPLWRTFILHHLFIALVFTGLAFPAIVSFIDLLPYYQRGSGTSYPASLINSFEWKHLLSMLFPSSIKANDVATVTDVTCRNVYFGLFGVIILAVFPPKPTQRNILLVCLALFTLLFSLGDATPIRKICYNIIPFMDTFRHPSQTRLFFIFALLLLVAPGLKKVLTGEVNLVEISKIKKAAWVITAIFISTVIIALTQSGILNHLSGFRFSQLRTTAKNIFDSISISDAIVLSGFIQIFFLAAFLMVLKKTVVPKKAFSFLWIANLFIMAQLVLPATFVSKTSPTEINKLINSSPTGFPVSGLERTIDENSKDALSQFDKIALTYFYNKKIGISHITYSPSFLTQQDKFIENDFLYQYVSSLPVVYIADSVVQLKDIASLNTGNSCHFVITDSTAKLNSDCRTVDIAKIKKLTANSFEIEAQTLYDAFLVLTQNYHHHWKVWIDGKETSIKKVNISFMGIALPAGKHIVVFRFIPANTLKAIWAMWATVILLFLAWLLSLIRQNRQQTILK